MQRKLVITGSVALTLITSILTIYIIFFQKDNHLKAKSSTATDLISQGHYARARELLITSNTKFDSLTSKQSILTTIQLALCEHALNRPQKALEYLTHIPDEKVPELSSYISFWKARALIKLKMYDDAELNLRHILNSTNNPLILQPALNYLGQIFQATDRPNDAIEIYFAQMERFYSTRPSVLWTLSKIYDSIGQPTKTRECYFKLIEQHKTSKEGLNAAIALQGPLNADETFHVAKTYFEHRKYKNAIKRFKKFIQIYPDDGRVVICHILLARSFSSDGKKDRAIDLLDIAHKKYDSAKALFLKAGILVKKNQDTQAIATYRDFAQRYPKHELADKALWQAAKAAERNGLFNKSKAAYSLLVQHHPDSNYNDDAKWGIGFNFFCLDSLNQALKTFKDLSQSKAEPHIVDQSLYWAGKTAMRLNLDEQASFFYGKAAKGFPRSYYSTKAVRLGYGKTAEINREITQKHILTRSVDIDRSETLYNIGLHTEARREYVQLLRKTSKNSKQLIALRDYFENIGLVDLAVSLSLQLASNEIKKREWTKIYPEYYLEHIISSADEADIDPYLILSVIRQESRFNKKATSRVGARGLMQIMPQTGKTLAGDLGIDDFQNNDLFEPNLSIRFGAYFLGNQMKYFKEGSAPHMSKELSLAAYNAGPHNARNWIQRFPHADVDLFIERIPFKETRLYVKLVLKNYEIYKALSHV